MKQYKREVSRAVRELDREKQKLEREQVKLREDMKKDFKMNQPKVVKQKAKDYARRETQIKKMYTMRTHLMGVEMQLQSIKSTDAMANAIKNATRAMTQMSRRMNMPQLTQIMQGFAAESAKISDTQEVLGEQIDDVMGEEDEVGADDAVVGQIMAEIQAEVMGSTAGTIPVGATQAAVPTQAKAQAVGMGGGGPGAGGPTPPAGGNPGPGAGGGGAAAPAGGPPAGGSGAGAAAAESLADRLAKLKQ